MVGSDALGERVAALSPDVHCFGHTHFAWDTVDAATGTRFVQAPLATPAERRQRPGSLLLLPRGEAGGGWQEGRRSAFEDALRARGEDAPWLPACVGW